MSVTRQAASAGRLCNASVTFFLLSFLTIAWSKEISETTRPIFTKFLAIGQGTLPWQPILGAKSATRLLSWDWHSKTDSRMGSGRPR